LAGHEAEVQLDQRLLHALIEARDDDVLAALVYEIGVEGSRFPDCLLPELVEAEWSSALALYGNDLVDERPVPPSPGRVFVLVDRRVLNWPSRGRCVATRLRTFRCSRGRLWRRSLSTNRIGLRGHAGSSFGTSRRRLPPLCTWTSRSSLSSLGRPRLNRGSRGARGAPDVVAVVPGGRRVHCALLEQRRELRHSAWAELTIRVPLVQVPATTRRAP
jgi:hypothetical protein